MAEERIEKDAELIEKYLPEEGFEHVHDSLFTDRELAAYLLAERSEMTWDEAAETMGITYGTYSGKVGGNVEEKKRKARATVALVELIEGDGD